MSAALKPDQTGVKAKASIVEGTPRFIFVLLLSGQPRGNIFVFVSIARPF